MLTSIPSSRLLVAALAPRRRSVLALVIIASLGPMGCPSPETETTDGALSEATDSSAETHSSEASTETAGPVTSASDPSDSSSTESTGSTLTDSDGSTDSMTTDSTTAPGTDSSNTSTETDSGTETDSDSDSETDTDAISCEVDPDATPQCGDGLVAPGEFCPGEVLSAHSSASRRRLSAADINADGAVDILVASEFEIRAFYNDGSSALHGYATDVSLGTVGIGRVIATGDFNGDGALDVTVARADQTLQVYRGNSFGAMTSLPPIVVGYCQGPPPVIALEAACGDRLEAAPSDPVNPYSARRAQSCDRRREKRASRPPALIHGAMGGNQLSFLRPAPLGGLRNECPSIVITWAW